MFVQFLRIASGGLVACAALEAPVRQEPGGRRPSDHVDRAADALNFTLSTFRSRLTRSSGPGTGATARVESAPASGSTQTAGGREPGSVVDAFECSGLLDQGGLGGQPLHA